jgi:hypothetical protein
VYGCSCTTMEYECVFVRIREILPIGVEVTVPAESQTWAEVILLDLNAISAREYHL